MILEFFYFIHSGNSKARRESLVFQLNQRYQFLLRSNRNDPALEIDWILERIIKELSYRILDSTEFEYSRVISNKILFISQSIVL